MTAPVLAPGSIVTCARRCAVVYAVDANGMVAIIPIVSGRLQSHRADVPLPFEAMVPIADAVARVKLAVKVAPERVKPMAGDLSAMLPAIKAALIDEVKSQRYEDTLGAAQPWHREQAYQERSAV